jgi:hypothetical protein
VEAGSQAKAGVAAAANIVPEGVDAGEPLTRALRNPEEDAADAGDDVDLIDQDADFIPEAVERKVRGNGADISSSDQANAADGDEESEQSDGAGEAEGDALENEVEDVIPDGKTMLGEESPDGTQSGQEVEEDKTLSPLPGNKNDVETKNLTFFIIIFSFSAFFMNFG